MNLCREVQNVFLTTFINAYRLYITEYVFAMSDQDKHRLKVSIT